MHMPESHSWTTKSLSVGPGIGIFESNLSPPWPQWRVRIGKLLTWKSNSSLSTVQNLLLSGQIQVTLNSSIRGLICKMSFDAAFNLFSSFQVQCEFSLSSAVRRESLTEEEWDFGLIREGIGGKFSLYFLLGENIISPSSNFHPQHPMKSTGVWVESRELP